MDLASTKVDSGALEQGVWIDDIPDLGDIALCVRDLGSTFVRTFQAKLVRQMTRDDRQANGRLKDDVFEAISARVMAEAVLVDWKNITDGGKPVKFSSEAALAYLTNPDHRIFAEGVRWAASNAHFAAVADRETVAKN